MLFTLSRSDISLRSPFAIIFVRRAQGEVSVAGLTGERRDSDKKRQGKGKDEKDDNDSEMSEKEEKCSVHTVLLVPQNELKEAKSKFEVCIVSQNVLITVIYAEIGECRRVQRAGQETRR